MAIVNHRDIATNGLDEEALTTSTAGEQVINFGDLATSGDLAEAFMGPTGCRRHEPKDFQFWGNRCRPTSQIAHRCDPNLPRNV